ncbi:CHAP domain-containing protein [Streptococcus catagoni]|uniref:CHAP domain-containing protein n=1 Tax=Streptococcus catagoni TaxID=2654874 RepID=UPI0014082481|nr:CHAP domain-containing protein [Streptococcus catagoni]
MKKDKLMALLMLVILASQSIQTVSVLAEETPLVVNNASDNQIESKKSESEVASTDGVGTSESSSSSVVSEPATEAPAANSSSSQPNDETASSPKISSSGPSTEPSETEKAAPAPKTKPGLPSSDQAAKTSPQPSSSPKVLAANKANVAVTNPAYQAPAPSSALDLQMPSAIASARYVDHWSGSDAYTHHLLSHRYGITAAQIDGYLQSTAIHYDSQRINGKKLLEWEKVSGLDVRAIVAIAMAESSLGTQGVATEPGANMFGYAAFDNAPQMAKKFNDEAALTRMTKETIIQNQNTSFAIQDRKAQRLSAGLLNLSLEGGVYFTDTSGTGKRRAQIMEEMDRWIDQHGGTPAIPAELRIQSSASVEVVPLGYRVSKLNQMINYSAASYPWGQCTWYVYNRAKELGFHFDAFMGNGGDWQYKKGYQTSHKPSLGSAVSFSPGQAGADPIYGHVAIVEEVKDDGSILISESNCVGLGIISYRTFSAAQASQLTYVLGQS